MSLFWTSSDPWWSNVGGYLMCLLVLDNYWGPRFIVRRRLDRCQLWCRILVMDYCLMWMLLLVCKQGNYNYLWITLLVLMLWTRSMDYRRYKLIPQGDGDFP